MRYYNIVITDPNSGKVLRQFTSFPNGKNDPGALNIELDLPVAPYAIPMGDAGTQVRVWGPSLADISQAANFNNANIAVYGGMQKGLPLANPAQAGLLAQGYIYQAFANWAGTNMTLDLMMLPGPSPKVIGQSSNLSFNWKAGTNLASAIKATLATAFPALTADININPKLIIANDEVGAYQNLVQFAQMIKELSADIIGGNYQGVDIQVTQSTFKVYDGTNQAAPRLISFLDLIGQPTYYAPNLISVTCVMRADIGIGDIIMLPPGQVTTTAQSLSQTRTGSVFQGKYQVIQMRHIGNFRQPNAEDWVTVFNVADLTPTAAVA